MQQLPYRECPVHAPATALGLVCDTDLPTDLATRLIMAKFGLEPHIAALVARLAGLSGGRQ
jgi:hypothetical protein